MSGSGFVSFSRGGLVNRVNESEREKRKKRDETQSAREFRGVLRENREALVLPVVKWNCCRRG